MLTVDAKRHFKTLTAIAKALGITPSAVSQWRERVPRGAAYQLQVITAGQLSVNPALYGEKMPTNLEPANNFEGTHGANSNHQA